MTTNGINNFVNALKEAGVNNWEAVTDMTTRLYNNDNAVNLLDNENEVLYNFSTAAKIAENIISVTATDYVDVHELKANITYAQAKKFVQALGLELNETQGKILLNIYGNNYRINPMTGDYVDFKELTEEELASLDELERAEYNRALEKYKKKTGMVNPVQVTI